MNAKEIQKVICSAEVLKRNLCCENVKYLFSDYECDVLSLNKSGYLTEYEVKISRSDFKADSRKRKILFYKQCYSTFNQPNKFYYCCPPGLIKADEVPKFAGLIYVSDKLEVIKTAPFMHKELIKKERVIEKFCRVMQERLHLGKCALTVKNEQIKARNK